MKAKVILAALVATASLGLAACTGGTQPPATTGLSGKPAPLPTLAVAVTAGAQPTAAGSGGTGNAVVGYPAPGVAGAYPVPKGRPTLPVPVQIPGVIPQPAATAPATLTRDGATDIAKSDLSKKKGLAVGQITVSKVEDKEWPDTSLGCLQAGKMYIQVITPGYLVVLSAGGQSFEYHLDRRGEFVLCEK